MYPRPSKRLIRFALAGLAGIRIREYEVVPVPLDELEPTEPLHMEYVPEELIELMRTHPENVPPIVIGDMEILDGHHRYLAALEAGLTHLWAIDLVDYVILF
jgi:ParB-like chromosome segregation protein Spo0J